MIEADVTEPTTIEWVSLVIFVARKFEYLRFSVDYRHWNAVIVRNSYQISRMY